MREKPKLCVNNDCMIVFYVPVYKLHMCLQCQACVDKRNELYAQQVQENG